MSRKDWADKRDEKLARKNGSRRVHRSGDGIADWASVDAGALVSAVAWVSSKGGALRFGYTRDGGAYAIGIMGDGEPYTEYVKPSEDIDQYLRDLAAQWEDPS